MKKFFEKYTYLWWAFSGTPFGLAMLIGAYDRFIEIPQVKLQSYSGYISNYGGATRTPPATSMPLPVFVIQFDNHEFYTEITKRENVLREHIPSAFNNKQKITVWVEKGSPLIEQVAVEDHIILKYHPPYWQAWTFLIIGIIFFCLGIYCIISYFHEAWGK